MTTIAYDHNAQQIAIDSRSTADGIVINESSVKYRKMADGTLWFFCGTVADIDGFVKCVRDDEKPRPNICVNAFIVKSDGVYLAGIDDDQPWTEKLEFNRAIGSGHQFAIAAMDLGKSAKDAVKYAATRCIYTGGKVRVYDIKLGKFVR